MFCVIYRSTKREQTYLYVEKKDDFSRVPDELMASFGTPKLAMLLLLDGRATLANADLEKVKQALVDQGYTFSCLLLLKIYSKKHSAEQKNPINPRGKIMYQHHNWQGALLDYPVSKVVCAQLRKTY